MLRTAHRRRFLLAAALIMTGATAARAEESHYFTIENDTSYPIAISNTTIRCSDNVTQEGSNSWPGPNIAPGATITVKWDDSNNILDYNGYGCDNKDKLVAVSFTAVGATGTQYTGHVGMIHKKFSGDWYNGQFYAQSINVNGSNGDYSDTDGDDPGDFIIFVCPGGTDSGGDNTCVEAPLSVMSANKNDQNWPIYHKTEDGWGFKITRPTGSGGSGGSGNGSDGDDGGMTGGGGPGSNCSLAWDCMLRKRFLESLKHP